MQINREYAFYLTLNSWLYHPVPSIKDTYMKMFYNISECLIICFKTNWCRNFIFSFKIKNNNIDKSINKTSFQILN